jgi:hypothetical protein
MESDLQKQEKEITDEISGLNKKVSFLSVVME